MNDDPIDVYRIGLGSDLHMAIIGIKIALTGRKAIGMKTIRQSIYLIKRNWRQRSYWGIWQAEHTVYPMNASRGLTADAARRRLIGRIGR